MSGEGVWEVDDEPERQGTPASPAPNKPSRGWSGEELDLSLAPPPRPSMRLWQMMVLVLVVAVGMAVALAVGWSAVFAGILFLLAAAIAMGVVASKRMSTQQDALLSIIAIAAERGMPLPVTIAAFADQYSGRGRRSLLELAANLHAGEPLSRALEASPRLVSKDAVLLAYVGERTGKLPEALRMAAASRAARMPVWGAIVSRLTYFLAMALGIEAITGFIMFSIVPKMEMIFKDFGVPLPQLTVFVIEASHFVIKYFYLFSPLILANILLLIYLPYSFTGWWNYDVPFFDRFFRRRHSALILRSLSLAVGSRLSIESALRTLEEHYPTWWVRRQLAAAEYEVQHGGPWIDALQSRGLLKAGDAELLRSATRLGNLEWAMKEAADGGERRLAGRLQVLIQMIFPLMVLLLGFVVFVVAAAFFLPLVTLISRIADT
ncbi:type II secretion system F family protein [Aquisphaera insulae]|uniref:type II secretion system F family protein n=1 Tax=Aquisphaera insulae TaxID=2712864 RepID=UPI0013EBC32F|nr:type II secretion system F family protein [Aquisphaera insulae]